MRQRSILDLVAAGIFCCILVLCLPLVTSDSAAGKAYTTDNLIRLHIIANSDSPGDQQIKERVRDAIVETVGPILGAAETVEEARVLVREILPDIEHLVARELREAGAENPKVKVSLGRYGFPARRYGSIVLPAGEYEALKVTIGRGQGENWWCILFPPLCFIDITNGTAAHAASGEAEGGEGRAMLVDEDELKELPVAFRFKLLEVIRASWEKVVLARASHAGGPGGLAAGR